ncbi:MAG: ankyrin repeat domain-containing protein, partial [Acidobacteriota bacterium]|nr:ankyrin repeat domain-containing protein [Acidobacteriota bacterium]
MKYPLLLLCMLLVGCNGLDIADRGNADENRDQATTPVQALMDGRPERARELLEAGADPNLANQFGDTALIWAVNDGQVDLVNLLLE